MFLGEDLEGGFSLYRVRFIIMMNKRKKMRLGMRK